MLIETKKWLLQRNLIKHKTHLEFLQNLIKHKMHLDFLQQLHSTTLVGSTRSREIKFLFLDLTFSTTTTLCNCNCSRGSKSKDRKVLIKYIVWLQHAKTQSSTNIFLVLLVHTIKQTMVVNKLSFAKS